MKLPLLPRHINRIAADAEFCFACNKEVSCFTSCCRELELSLTPYDVMRLKNALDMHSHDFLDTYVIIEQDEDDIFPRCYLTMVDDGQASCVFVDQNGCTVYQDRPGACRTYPLGRAARRLSDGSVEEFFVLLKEDHCKGFAETPRQNAINYSSQQGLEPYNRMNDALASLLQCQQVRQGGRLTSEQEKIFILALYDLDAFREKLREGHPDFAVLPDTDLEDLADDEKLLLYAIEWLKRSFFPDTTPEKTC
ncbi:MAG: YkgJ family cysteine cluster protein [Desulfopila sp.]|jgi:Fe-S-cluster containining protein|nr:YkgJ family cysteine cluster protein [Desulfopila sp.]